MPSTLQRPPQVRSEAQHAALDAVEPERLLDGEDEQTTYVDDAVHWTKVYAGAARVQAQPS